MLPHCVTPHRDPGRQAVIVLCHKLDGKASELAEAHDCCISVK